MQDSSVDYSINKLPHNIQPPFFKINKNPHMELVKIRKVLNISIQNLKKMSIKVAQRLAS